MTASNFAAALAFVLEAEGAWSDRPDDTPTNQGITLATYREALEQPDLTADDLRAMTDEQRDRIYLMNYWQPIRGDDLPSGVDLAVFDFAVNAGPRTAGRMLQRIVGAMQDGVIGPQTIAAAQATIPEQAVMAMCQDRINYYQMLGKPQFLAGWTARANACEAAALALVT